MPEMFDPEELEEMAAVFEAMTGLPVCECEHHGWTTVASAGSGPGFTGVSIGWWTLACGCSDADLSADTAAAAR